MVLFDMLTADAASKHGHEFSQRSTSPSSSSAVSSSSRVNGSSNSNQQNVQQPWLIPPRLPFKVVSGIPYAVRSTRAQSPVQRGTRTRRSVGAAAPVMGELKEEPEEQDQEPQKPQGLALNSRVGLLFGSYSSAPRTEMSMENLRMPGAYQRTPPSPKRATTPVRDLSTVEPLIIPPPLSTGSLDLEALLTESPQTIVAPETPVASIRSASVSVEESQESIVSKREHRPKTRYEFAHPPPTSGKSGQPSKQPKILVQMHHRRASGFHKPIFEVVPVSRIGEGQGLGLKHKFKKLSRTGAKAKGALSTDDWAVMRVSQYASTAESMIDELSENSTVDSRDVLGVISLAPQSSQVTTGQSERKVQILVDNAIWEATSTAEGMYDLKSVSMDIPSARWYVPKSQRSSMGGIEQQSKATKLYFAPLHTSTRKHPTMGCITREHLDVYDPYITTASDAEALENEMFRRLIVVSAFWVMACEGWSPHLSVPHVSETARPVTSQSYSARSESISITTPASEKPRKLSKLTPIPSEEPLLVRPSRSMTQTEAPSKPPPRGLRSISLGRSLSLSGKRKSVDASMLTSISNKESQFVDSLEAPMRVKSAEPRPRSTPEPVEETPSKSATGPSQTVQFRHLLPLSTDSRPLSQSSSPTPSIHIIPPESSSASSISRRSPNLVEHPAPAVAENQERQPLEVPLIVEKVSTSVTEKEVEKIQVPKRRSQSVHWTWRLPMPNLPSISNPVAGLFASQISHVDSKESEETLQNSKESTIVAVREISASGSGTQSLETIVELNDATEELEVIPSLHVGDQPEQVKSKEEDIVLESDAASEMIPKPPTITVIKPEPLNVKESESQMEDIMIQEKESTQLLEEDGDSSDELELFGVASPDQYLRDFDRLQASWRPMTPQPWHRQRHESSSKAVEAVNSMGRKEETVEYAEVEVPAIAIATTETPIRRGRPRVTSETVTPIPTKSLFGNIKRSMSRKRWNNQENSSDDL